MESRNFYIHLLSDGDLHVTYDSDDNSYEMEEGITSVAMAAIVVPSDFADLLMALVAYGHSASSDFPTLLRAAAIAGAELVEKGWKPKG